MDRMTFVFVLSAMVSYAVADFAAKQSAGRVPASIATLVCAVAALVVPVVWVATDAQRSSSASTWSGVSWAALTGIALSAASGFLFLLFSHGLALSLASPLARAGGVAVAALLGILLLREHVDPRYAVGLLLATIGVLLIALE